MNPKTFQISLRRPFGNVTKNVYVFLIHASSWEEAAAWVERVLPGADLAPARAHKANPPATPRVGDTKPVSIIDSDAFSRRKAPRGPGALEFWPEGHWRRSEEAVALGLAKVMKLLQDERTYHQQSFTFDLRCYEQNGRDWVFERLQERRAAIEKTLAWQDNLWAEYKALEARRIFELPEPNAAAAA